jgi:hypothetical protein
LRELSPCQRNVDLRARVAHVGADENEIVAEEVATGIENLVAHRVAVAGEGVGASC